MAKEQVIVKVDGKPRILKLGLNGFIEIEEKIGKPIAKILENEMAFKDLRTIFQVALKRGGMEGITAEETGDIMDTMIEEKGLSYLVEKLTEVVEGSMGMVEQGKSFRTSEE